ncbi:SMP-30/gluconolactonase/LRE family protein [Rhodocista pekingensis]|uniref:SMP-30/gluconolactonase/LRE family protein n=1 Tax=Rhodocista pekingensis TaxID=201185 RepID=A0ABW2KYL3_9PROT
MVRMREIASGLAFPEGPVALADGSLLVVEIARGTLTRIAPDGALSVVADLGGGPNGAAIGPDGRAYVCNNGGFSWHRMEGLLFPGEQPPDYAGGSLQRVDLLTGAVETLFTHAAGADGVERPLNGPNDIVFDRTGGFWFSDLGKHRARERDRSGVYYCNADGKAVREVTWGLDSANGIGLSPDGGTLYVAETYTRQLWAFDLEAPGRIRPAPGFFPDGGRFLAGAEGFRFFDSLAVDAEGHVCVATPGEGGISVYAPDGRLAEFLPTGDPYTTNLCFGGPDLRTAFVTLSATGRVVAVDWPRPGLPLAFTA